MKSHSVPSATAFLFLLCFQAQAATLYVDVNSSNPVPPYTDWTTAATNIQDAVDASSDGDLVLVTNGVYQSGGEPLSGYALTNRVVINKRITVASVNGPQVTAIVGNQVPGTIGGDSAVRCAYLADGAELIGFTLKNGATLTNNSPDIEVGGGGLWCQSTNSVVSNCVIVSNFCPFVGGGVYSGTLRGCQVNYNTNRALASFIGGGGAAYSVLLDSTIQSNSCGMNSRGGGAFSCFLSNCVIAGNSYGGVLSCTLTDCSILNNTNWAGGGGAVRSTLNNCLLCNNGGGGAYESMLNGCTILSNWGGGAFNSTNPPGQSNYCAWNSSQGNGGGLYLASGSGLLSNWTFLSNSAGIDGGGLYFYNLNNWTLTGCTFSGNSAGGNGGGAAGPFGTMFFGSNCTFTGNSAAGDGGGAYHAAMQSCSLVGNSAGDSGGGVYGIVNNCVLSANVAQTNGGGVFTYIAPGTSLAFSNNVFYLNRAANGGGAYGGNFISGCSFVSNSATGNGGGANSGGKFMSCSFTNNSAGLGGAIYGDTNSSVATATNCMIISNRATFGGGAGFETLINCTIIGNSATRDGGGIYNNPLQFVTNCLIKNNLATNNGGGTYGAKVGRCIVAQNSAWANGGGGYNSSMLNCIVSNNAARTNGGGIFAGGALNSLLTGNSATVGGGAYNDSPNSGLNNSTIVNNLATNVGGGAYFFNSGIVTSCILYNNSAPVGPNYSGFATYSYCCTTPLPAMGGSNIISDPAFVNFSAGNFRLQSNSPCVNTGTAGPGMGQTDLDGRPRTVNGRVDIGAYEFQGPAMDEFITWLQGYGLPTDGSADFIDSDHDGMSNWQEWVSGTDPTNLLSVLKMLPPTTSLSGLSLNWESVSNRTYFLQGGADLGASPPFSVIQSNIVGQVGTTGFLDTNPITSGVRIYRVGIQQ